MRSPLAGWTRFPIALIVAIAGALVAVPAVASAAPAHVSIPVQAEPVSPSEGELVAADPTLRWSASDGTGYEVRWNAGGDLDSSGALDPTVDGGRAFPGGTSHQLTGLTAATYHWQVRALPDGDWSGISTFYLDIQLDTLTPGAETGMPATPAPVEPRPESGAGLDLSTAVHGFVWIAAASSFAGLLLAVVGREWLRLRRQQRES